MLLNKNLNERPYIADANYAQPSDFSISNKHATSRETHFIWIALGMGKTHLYIVKKKESAKHSHIVYIPFCRPSKNQDAHKRASFYTEDPKTLL